VRQDRGRIAGPSGSTVKVTNTDKSFARVDLPGLNGLGVLRRLAHDGVLQHTRVIMLTVRSAESEILEALELGACDHVAKPFSLPVLLQRIRHTLQV
jgi:DNA-binding response OmpR family regulator